MYPIGLAVLHSSLLSKENFSALKNAGIDAAEISIAHTDIPYSELDFDKIRRDADLAGLHLWSVHCQFTGVDALSSCDTELNKRWLERNKDVVNRVAAAGIDKMVMHTCDCANDDRAGSIEHAMYYLNELVEYAHPKGFSIAAENLPRDCLGNTPEEFLHILSCNEKLRACFDFNHSLMQPTEDFLEKIADRIITVHVSDRDDINERHWMPGEGVLDWVKLMDIFDKIGYEGVWMYELGLEPGATIDRPILRYEDFVDNAHSLFARKAPVRLGTPKDNLGMWGPNE
ncbi:MAG: sugar phosphate isomerase/epimerase [Clostridia bacterium]|nr:sugar phosphate isomerase/epimerase [Clostridia bacterium]